MRFIKPQDVKSPKSRWYLFDVLLDDGEDRCAYALGEWDGERCIGFRWNGTKEKPIGNPLSRGLPTWIVLDERLHKALLPHLPKEKRQILKNFLRI